MYENAHLFEKTTDFQIYKKSPKMNLSDLIELYLSGINNIELPINILSNLEQLSLVDVYNIKFLTKDSNILLDK